MRKHGTYPRRLSEFSRRILRAVWRWAERQTWEQVRFRLAQGLTLTLLVWLIYLAMGIGFARINAKTTRQFLDVLEMQNKRVTMLENNDQLRTSAVLNATATVSLVNLTAQQNAILTGYAERYHAGRAVVNDTELPSLYGGR